MKVTKLKEHPVIEHIKPYLISYIKKCDPENKTNINPSPKERDAFEMLFGLSNITECIDQLYYSVEFLSGFRKNIVHKSMNRHDYIIYSTENILFRITSVFDRCLRLSNKIYNIGILDRKCRANTIIKHSNIKGTLTEKTLHDLNNFTDKFREKRNEISHASSFNDPKLNDLQGFHILLYSTDVGQYYKNIFKQEADDYVATKKDEFLKNITELEEIVNNYFYAILPKIKVIVNNKK